MRRLTWSQAAEEEWKTNLLKDTATIEDAQEEYYCVPKQGGGAYLNRMLIESRMVQTPVIRYEGSSDFNTWPEHIRAAEIADWCNTHLLPLLMALDPNQQHAFGEDFARSGDLTVMAPLAIEQTLKRHVPFLLELKNVPFRNQEQILYYICDRLPRLMSLKLDARGNGQYLAEQAAYKYGAKVEQVMLSQAWYLENMPKLKAAFEDDGIAIPQDADVLNDLRAIQVIKGTPKIPDGQTQKGRHGDAAIALALAYAASLADYWEAGWTPVNQAVETNEMGYRTDGHFNKQGAW